MSGEKHQHGGRRPNAGRPTKRPEDRRVHISATIAPETDAILARERRPGESLGQTIDRLIQQGGAGR